MSLTIEPPRVVARGWLLRLRLTNGGTPATFEASASRGTGTAPNETSSWTLPWRGHEGTATVRLEAGVHELLRLGVAHTASADAKMIFPTALSTSRLWSEQHAPITPDAAMLISVRIRDCERDAVVVEASLRLVFRKHDLVPTLEFCEPRPVDAPAITVESKAPAPPAAGPTDRTLDPADIAHLEDVLRCSVCSSTYSVAETELVCNGCGARAPIVDTVPILLNDSTLGSALERIDYDTVHGVTDQLVADTGRRWNALIKGLGLAGARAVEIGAGTGALTLGLLRENAVDRLTATDVSPKFLRVLAPRAARYPTPLSLVACDANESHFRSGAFDLVVGRSILHHLLDYEQTLANCRDMLAPGGAAVFFEPVLEGKAIVVLLISLILGCEQAVGGGALSSADQDALSLQIRHQLKSELDQLDRDALAQIEDKYIFEIAELRKLGTKLGFTDVEFVNSDEVVPTYWPYVVQTCLERGVPPEKIAAYKWIGIEFANTYGLIFRDQLVTPMGFFVFRT